MLEKLIFNILAFSLFIIVFFKIIRKNDTNYISILILEAIGIAISFIEIKLHITENMFLSRPTTTKDLSSNTSWRRRETFRWMSR